MIKKRAFWAMVWSIVGQFGSSGLSAIFMLLFARLLTPSDFGVFAAGVVVTSLGGQLALLGVSTALVQRKELGNQAVSTAFWISFSTTTILALVLSGLSMRIALAFGDVRISGVIAPLAVGMVLNNASAVFSALLMRDLNLKVLSIRTLLANLLSGLAAIPLALHGYGAYALVTQYVGGIALSLIATLHMTGWPLRLRFDRAGAREMLKFGTPVMMSDSLYSFNTEGTKLFVGFFLGTQLLGVYSVASRFPNLLLTVFAATPSNVVFPFLSAVNRSSPERMLEAYFRLLRLAGTVFVPAFLLCAVLSRELIAVLLGPQWSAAGTVTTYLCLAAIPVGFHYINGAVAMAIGQPRMRFQFTALGTIIGVVLLASATHFGLAWVGAALLLRSLITEPLLTRGLARSLGGTFPRALSVLRASGLAGVALVAVAVLVRMALGGASALLVCSITSVVALAAYAAFIGLFDRHVVEEVWSVFGRRAAE